MNFEKWSNVIRPSVVMTTCFVISVSGLSCRFSSTEAEPERARTVRLRKSSAERLRTSKWIWPI